MEITILHLYPDVMSLYGEYANIAVLRRHLEKLGVTVTVRQLLCDDEPRFEGADLIYMGAGTERTQKYVLTLLAGQGPALRAAVDAGALVFFTGSAMEALGLADFVTEETDRRSPVDVIAQTDLIGTPVVGFMNKCSLTHGVSSPLFPRLLLGFGNDAELGPEGYAGGSVFATHITGPVLVKNPALLDWSIRRLALAKGWRLPEALPVLPHEQDAYAVTLSQLRARVK